MLPQLTVRTTSVGRSPGRKCAGLSTTLCTTTGPIAASGTDDQAEYVFRQLAQYTGGHFIFLTYEETPQASGEPGTDHSVPEGSYTVEDLDALVVRLISDELAALLGQQQ